VEESGSEEEEDEEDDGENNCDVIHSMFFNHRTTQILSDKFFFMKHNYLHVLTDNNGRDNGILNL